MKNQSSEWRKPTKSERERFKQAAENTLRAVGRPKLSKSIKHIPISIKLDPRIVKWAKKEAKRLGIGYQTFLNKELLKKAA